MCFETRFEKLITKLIHQSGISHNTVSSLIANMVKMLPDPVLQHCFRVSEISRQFAGFSCREFGNEDMDMLESAGFLHDIGKLFICDSILNKPDVLTPGEYRTVQQHAPIGHKIISTLGVSESVATPLLYHHENQDGSGYPSGLIGNQIPPLARIIHIVDVYDALTNHRPYRQAYSSLSAIEIMKHHKKHFDPVFLPEFVSLINENAFPGV